jgi:hypothetical protein
MTDSEVYHSAIPFGPPPIDCIVVYCCDGRFVDQIEDFLHNGLDLGDFDRLVVPGGAGRMLDPSPMAKLQFMIHAHRLTRVVLIQHEDCGYYNHERHIAGDAQKTQRAADVRQVIAQIESDFPKVRIDAFDAVLDEGEVAFEPLN